MTFDELFKIIPGYVFSLLRLLTRPRQFFADQDLADKKIFLQSLLFLVNSAFISFVLRIPFFGVSDAYWQTAMFTAMLYLPTAVILGCVAFGCCRVVGGKGSLIGNVTIFCYFAGVSVLLFALFFLVAQGIIKVGLPDQFALYQEYMKILFADSNGLDDARFNALSESSELLTSMLVLGAGFLSIAVWFLFAWPAFGAWNGISRGRTAISFILFVVIGYAISIGLGMAQFGAGVTLF